MVAKTGFGRFHPSVGAAPITQGAWARCKGSLDAHRLRGSRVRHQSDVPHCANRTWTLRSTVSGSASPRRWLKHGRKKIRFAPVVVCSATKQHIVPLHILSRGPSQVNDTSVLAMLPQHHEHLYQHKFLIVLCLRPKAAV